MSTRSWLWELRTPERFYCIHSYTECESRKIHKSINGITQKFSLIISETVNSTCKQYSWRTALPCMNPTKQSRKLRLSWDLKFGYTTENQLVGEDYNSTSQKSGRRDRMKDQ